MFSGDHKSFSPNHSITQSFTEHLAKKGVFIT